MKPWLTLFVDRHLEREPRLALFLDRRVDVESCLALFLDRRVDVESARFPLGSSSSGKGRSSYFRPTLQGEEPLALFLDRRVDVESCSARFPLGQIVLLAGRAAVGLISPRRIDSPRGRTLAGSFCRPLRRERAALGSFPRPPGRRGIVLGSFSPWPDRPSSGKGRSWPYFT